MLPTVDPELGAQVRAELIKHGVDVTTGVTAERIRHAPAGADGRLRVDGCSADGTPYRCDVDLVLLSVGVRPDTELLVAAGAATGVRGAVVVDEAMRTGLPDVYAAGDCVITHHRLAGITCRYAGSLGTQIVEVFDLVAARTGLRESEATADGHRPVSTTGVADDHKAYYPGEQPITIRITGDADTGRLLGAQLIGARGTKTAKRVDTDATALFHGITVEAISDLDLSYTPPLGSPWDAVQTAAQAWGRQQFCR